MSFCLILSDTYRCTIFVLGKFIMTKQIVTKQIVAFFSASQCEAENSHIAKDVKEFSEGINSSFYQYDGCSTLKKFFSFGKVNAYGTGTQADAFMTKLIKFHDKHPRGKNKS